MCILSLSHLFNSHTVIRLIYKTSGVVISEGLSFDDYFINGKCAPDFVATSFPGHSELGAWNPCTYHGA